MGRHGRNCLGRSCKLHARIYLPTYADIFGQLAMPVGLVNLGNTCYMNATLQAMRAIPELQVALQKYALSCSVSYSVALISGHHSSTPTGLPMALRNLYTNMSKTTDSVTPSNFVAALRQAFPQFAEQTRASGIKALMGGGFAQQGNASYNFTTSAVAHRACKMRRSAGSRSQIH